MAYTTLPGAGSRLTAATLSALMTEVRPIIAHKTSDESVTSSTTFQADDHLSVPFAASTTYIVDAWMPMEGATAGDFKMQLVWTGTVARLDYSLFGLGNTPTVAEGDYKGIAQLGATGSPAPSITIGTTTANWVPGWVHGLMVTTTSGTLTVEWAQNASSGTATIVKRGSWLRLIPVA